MSFNEDRELLRKPVGGHGLPDRLFLCTRCRAGVLFRLATGPFYCGHCGYKGPDGSEYKRLGAKPGPRPAADSARPRRRAA